ncbi:unnamed protein product [Pleuronectes platessa]|uniref:Uncharacterized protein n=1 Tax=Pleuronectes platessa TaxID=8262 RepID=A0A9N7VAM5_PLEPL|nr:unnamed protein product [Pleuronectes platessa]
MFIFVVKPLGTCRGWGSSRSVALLSAPPEAQCVRHREVLIRWHLTASLVGGLSFSCTAGRCPSPARKAGRWRGPGTAVSGGHSRRVSGPSRRSPQLRRPLGEPSGWRLAAD